MRLALTFDQYCRAAEPLAVRCPLMREGDAVKSTHDPAAVVTALDLIRSGCRPENKREQLRWPCTARSRRPMMKILAKSFGIVLVLASCAINPAVAQAQPEVDRNVIYGMYSGLALTLDVYYPEQPNGLGILFVFGSGWHTRSVAYSARQPSVSLPRYYIAIRDGLVERGFTVVIPNYRLAPTFRYPAAVEDLQRAVRYVRANAEDLGIDPASLGVVGHSSGGHLAALLATRDGYGDAEAEDTVEVQSAKPQAVVAVAGVYDLTREARLSGVGLGGSSAPIASFLGEVPGITDKAAAASPVNHLSADDPPFLIIHGRGDPLSPFSQAELMTRALEEAGVEVEFLATDEGHGPVLNMDVVSDWLTRHLSP